MINIPKGTKDVLPADSYKWQYVEDKARSVAKAYNLKEIRTPVFEYTELFLRGVGETTDVVTKEMYTFKDKGDRSITLKPEGTAGVARSFIENGLASTPMPLKMFYIIPAFRYERPQAGRLREFHQFGVEVYGSATPQTDAEVIAVANDLISSLGLKAKLFINSIGCKECRKKFNDALKEYLRPNLNKMCPDCQTRFDKNPMRILDCKVPECKEINQNAPTILEYLCDDCKAHFDSVQKYLQLSGISYEINPKIVRGLDYYTRTVFEFVSEEIGSQGTVLGGGRYDGLIEEIGGSHTPAVGFAAGLERLLMLMENTGAFFPQEPAPVVYLAGMDEACREKSFEIAVALRSAGIACEVDHMNRSIKAQFKYADKLKAKYVAVIGGNELLEGVMNVKNMSNSTQESVAFEAAVAYFSR
ncbi:MAG: histidine--tRNA ligase [Clostridia bacterium]|nr:histidine--tRNA ligase [Clostridia bacterium]